MQKNNQRLPNYAAVALNLPIPELFHYLIPENMKSQVRIGMRVRVPFGKRKKIGYIVAFPDVPKVRELKSLERLIDAAPVIDEHLLSLTKWVADYYACAWGEVLKLVTPPARKARSKKTLTDSSLLPYSFLSSHSDLFSRIEVIPREPQLPTREQQRALDLIVQSLHVNQFKTILVYGVTGSGKTEIYLQSIAECLKQGKSALVLVPEIAITYQIVKRFKDRFGNKVAVLHSGLTPSERYEQWKSVKRGDIRIVVGVRSAVFAPLYNLGLIIVDEEHETSYKQGNTPRYNARDVAVLRGKMLNATVVLGSATPSLESYYNAKINKYQLAELPNRIDNRLMPKFTIIDIKDEVLADPEAKIVCRRLREAISDRLAKKEQTILFLNQRGYARIVLCRVCGHRELCEDCSTTVTYHLTTNQLQCHYCGKTYPIPKLCPECGGKLIRYLGVGTEQVETEMRQLFPEANIARLDMDIRKSPGLYETVLENFILGKTDILVGTQMIAKGIDVPNVTLVGVINADTSLTAPDFRGAERTYALLTQVAGRAGRGNIPGEVIVQTFYPNHPAIIAAKQNTRHEFYQFELNNRKKLVYPPFRHLGLIVVSHRKLETARSVVVNLADLLRENVQIDETTKSPIVEIYGPAVAPIPKLQKKYRFQILLKAKETSALRELYQTSILQLPQRTKIGNTSITIDVDPIQMM
ncbi:MAG: primosomal protein N' [bacterium]|nr:primosomal protein N' [bacterium]